MVTTIHQAKKHFGQHFLQNKLVIAKIIHLIHPLSSEHFIEIGPGTGALTSQLLPNVARLIVMEIDQSLSPGLKQQYQNYNNFELMQTDALNYDWAGLASTQRSQKNHNKIRIAGNLPYNIATPLITKLLEADIPDYDCHFMVQKEVAERITAEPGNHNYGYLSLITHYFADVEYILTVSPDAFIPRPKVESAVIRIKPRKPAERPDIDYQEFKHWVGICFAHKRKTINNNIKKYLAPGKFAHLSAIATTQHMLEQLLEQRAEQLNLEQFRLLINQLQIVCNLK